LLRVEQLVDFPAEMPQRTQFRQVLEHLDQVLPFRARQLLVPLDDQEAVLVDELRLLLVGRPAPPHPLLLLFALATARTPATGVAAFCLLAPQASDAVENLVGDVL